MNMSSVRYLIKEGFRNTWVNRMMSVASIAVLMSCLILIGSALMIFANIDALMSRIEDENVVMVFIKDEADEAGVNALGESLKSNPNISETVFVSKEQAWNEQLSSMEDAQKEFFTQISSDIPLPNAYKVTLKDLGQFDKTVKEINALDNVYSVRENKDLAQKLVAIRQGISVIAIVIIAVLFAISMFIIANTIRLTVYSRRLEISIMKSVGATNGFVQLPFIVEGIILGITSGIISLAAVWGIYEIAIAKFSDLFTSIGLKTVPFTDLALQMLGGFILVGIISGVGGSLITMRKYLTKEGSEISAI